MSNSTINLHVQSHSYRRLAVRENDVTKRGTPKRMKYARDLVNEVGPKYAREIGVKNIEASLLPAEIVDRTGGINYRPVEYNPPD